MECMMSHAKCDEGVAKFVLSLGATVNMNGTALYEAICAIFIAQMHGVPMTIGNLFAIVITATMAAVGAATVPSAGLVTLLMVLNAVNLDMYASDVVYIFAIDWFLDRCRTVVNVWGDVVACDIVNGVHDKMVKVN
eukprot:CAMPEP_0113916492 /NCGR_PEP_ID=MMETSP0780_2-20120614/32110_1 /TAXON_ID=652834 /ORGANISM="Palpitomonas bilix" /LENGTH=135 /DNA_ID=CAMNT_0000915763 /DNA_START=261 /DNA_END=668 /DNA_ORIENTATION=- /assembly_acc=CAM_ASM_000599